MSWCTWLKANMRSVDGKPNKKHIFTEIDNQIADTFYFPEIGFKWAYVSASGAHNVLK